MPNLATNKQGSLLEKQLFEALTEQEITRLLEALLAVTPLDLRDKALDQLQPDTRQTVQQILSIPSASRDPEVSLDTPVSMAKLAQTWASLWQQWDSVVREAAQEEGAYLTQEAHWEPPYFDETAFIEDLEQIAKKMRPLIQAAVQHSFSPDIGFAEALAAAEEDVAAALPEWIYLEGFPLEENLTFCLLEWEWLQFKEAEQDAFAFAQLILDLKDSFSHISLDSSALLDFLTQLPETDQQDIFNGLTQHQEASPWKELLSTPYSPWYAFYLDCIEQYAPERYLDTLRATIPQQWQNGLPVIEDLLAKKEYRESLLVLRDTLQALLKSERVDEAWTPATSLLAVAAPQYPADTARLENHQKLLNYYQQAAQGLDQTELVNVLKLQLI
ncbi:MAG: hypothetical protein HYR94_23560, partial [Chloroflexi bacterium]|nr:hypothetical protein [Chloroflexota bacterium]